MKLDWTGTIQGGRVVLNDTRGFRESVSMLFREGEIVTLTVQEGMPRSNQQLRYLFGVVYAVALEDEQFGGWTKDDIHAWMKAEYLNRTRAIDGTIHEVPGSTSELTTAEMTHFVDAVRRRLSHIGIYTPDPNEEADG